MEFDRMLAELFADEDSARTMATRLMELAKSSPAAAAAERESLITFLRGPMERHMAYEERFIFPHLVRRGLQPEVQVAEKQHIAIREEATKLEGPCSDEEVARAIFLAARLMLHHTNFESDYIYPELTHEEWRDLLRETVLKS